jgi:hypothetical protein
MALILSGAAIYGYSDRKPNLPLAGPIDAAEPTTCLSKAADYFQVRMVDSYNDLNKLKRILKVLTDS